MAEPNPKHQGPPQDPPDIFTLVSQRQRNGVVERLVEAPELVNAQQPSTGLTPLHLAAAHGYPEMVRTLLAMDGAAVELKDHWGRTALDVAKACNHLDCAEELLRATYSEFFEGDDDPYPEEDAEGQ